MQMKHLFIILWCAVGLSASAHQGESFRMPFLLPQHPSGRAVLYCTTAPHTTVFTPEERHMAVYFTQRGIAFFVLNNSQSTADVDCAMQLIRDLPTRCIASSSLTFRLGSKPFPHLKSEPSVWLALAIASPMAWASTSTMCTATPHACSNYWARTTMCATLA